MTRKLQGAEAVVTCHFCGMPATGKVIESKCGTAVAHFECWYESAPFLPEERDPVTGELPVKALRTNGADR